MTYSNMRQDIQDIINTHGIHAELIRQSPDVGSYGDFKYLNQTGYTIVFIMQDITKNDRKIHEMGLAVPGNVKAFFYNEYPDSITGNGTLQVEVGDMIKDTNNYWWRAEQMIGKRKAKSKEIFKSFVLKKIDLE